MGFTSLTPIKLVFAMLSIITLASGEKQDTLDLADHKDVTLVQMDEGQLVKNDALTAGKGFHITKEGKRGASYLCNTRQFNKESKLQFKSGWLWNKRYKGTDKCLFFWDPNSETFINVEENDMSVLVSKKTFKKHTYAELMLFDTNKYAPGPHPYTYGGQTGRRLITNDTGANVLCYKWLNMFQLKTENWIAAQTYKLRHHKGCNFNLFYKDVDPKKLKPKKPWKGDDDDDDVKDDEEEKCESTGTCDEEKPPGEKKPDKGETSPEWGLRVDTPFYVQTMLPSGRRLDIVGNNLVIKTHNTFSSQVWKFQWRTKTIVSEAYSGRSWDIERSGSGSNMQIWSTNGAWFQHFKYQDLTFKNERGKVLEVAYGADAEGQNAQVGNFNGGMGQRWKVIYLDEAGKDETTKHSKHFGFDSNRPFYIVSRLPNRRVIDLDQS